MRHVFLTAFTMLVFVVGSVAPAGPTNWGATTKTAHGGKRGTIAMVDKVSDSEDITNDTGGKVNDLEVTYSNDNRPKVKWNAGATGGTPTPGWAATAGPTLSDDGNSYAMHLAGSLVDRGGTVNVNFNGSLNQMNYVKKEWEWSFPPGNGGGIGGGGSLSEVVPLPSTTTTIADKRVSYLHLINPTETAVEYRNFRWKLSQAGVTGAQLLSPSFWSLVPVNPTITVAANDFSVPIPIYGLSSDRSDTLAIRYDRYVDGQYQDTLYGALKHNGSGWDFITGMEVTNTTGSTQTALSCNNHEDMSALITADAGSGDFGTAVATLNGSCDIDSVFSGGSILDGQKVSVWTSGTTQGDACPYVRNVLWGEGGVAAKDWAFYLYGDFADIVYDVLFQYTNLYDMAVSVSDLQYAITNTFLDTSEMQTWTGWAPLGDGSAALQPGETATFTIQGVRPTQGVSAKGSNFCEVNGGLKADAVNAGVKAAEFDDEVQTEEWWFSHQDMDTCEPEYAADFAELKTAAGTGETVQLTEPVTVTCKGDGLFFVGEERFKGCIKVDAGTHPVPCSGMFVVNLTGLVSVDSYGQYTLTLSADPEVAASGPQIKPVAMNNKAAKTDAKALTNLVRLWGSAMGGTIDDGYGNPIMVIGGVPGGDFAVFNGVLWNEGGSVVVYRDVTM